LKGSEAIRHQGVPDPLAPPVVYDETSVAEHLQVMTHRRLSLAEWFDEVAHTDLAPFRGGEDRNDAEQGGISQCGETCRQFDRTGFVERCREDRRTTRVDRVVEQSAVLAISLTLPLTSVNTSTIINASTDTNASR
jgi:hypothetical protein